jgi:hypothetical protein
MEMIYNIIIIGIAAVFVLGVGIVLYWINTDPDYSEKHKW